MKFAFLMNKFETLNPESDTGLLFIEESQRRGQEVFWLSHDEIVLKEGTPFGFVRRACINREEKLWWKLEEVRFERLDSFDAIFMRHDPPFDETYLTATYILDFLCEKTFVINNHAGIRRANEKIYAFNFPNLIPSAIITSSTKEIISFVDEHRGKAVLKPLYLMAGLGVYFLRDDDPNVSSIIESATDYGKKHVIVQEYIKDIVNGDKRVLLLNGKPIGAMVRVPRAGEFRANLRCGSTCVKTSLTERDLSICDAIVPSLIRDGLYFVGVDIIGEFLTEVNVTSPTGMQQINRLENVQLERDVINFVESKVS